MTDRDTPPVPLHAATRRQMMIGAAAAVVGLASASIQARAASDDDISHSAEAIHMETVFQASRQHVFTALTDAPQFDKVAQLSAAMRSMPAGGKPTQISREAGGAFVLFGGYITGRQLELIFNERIVQAWRSEGWKPGEYSIARFQLEAQGAGTKIVFDHRGFPDGQAQSLAEGWRENYWQPLQKYLLGEN